MKQVFDHYADFPLELAAVARQTLDHWMVRQVFYTLLVNNFDLHPHPQFSPLHDEASVLPTFVPWPSMDLLCSQEGPVNPRAQTQLPLTHFPCPLQSATSHSSCFSWHSRPFQPVHRVANVRAWFQLWKLTIARLTDEQSSRQRMRWTGRLRNPYWRGRLSTVKILIKIALPTCTNGYH